MFLLYLRTPKAAVLTFTIKIVNSLRANIFFLINRKKQFSGVGRVDSGF